MLETLAQHERCCWEKLVLFEKASTIANGKPPSCRASYYNVVKLFGLFGAGGDVLLAPEDTSPDCLSLPKYNFITKQNGELEQCFSNLWGEMLKSKCRSTLLSPYIISKCFLYSYEWECFLPLPYLRENKTCGVTSSSRCQAEIDALKRENDKLREKICQSIKLIRQK